MSFFAENKLIFGAVGLAVSSAALGFVFGRSSERSSPDNIFVDVGAEGSPLAKYVLSYGIRESAPLKQLRQVSHFCKLILNYACSFTVLNKPVQSEQLALGTGLTQRLKG